MKTSGNQHNGTSTEMQLAGLGYKSMRIEYNINTANVPALAANDSFVVQLTAIFDGSYKNTRVEVVDENDSVIATQFINNPPNNFGTPVTIGFSVGSLDAVNIVVRAEFTNTASYVPDLSYQGVSNWTNGIYLRNWHLTHYRRNSKQEVVSDTSDYFYRNKYLFSFQGQEANDEINGIGNNINYKYRMHDTRLGRFFSIDPLYKSYPWNSTYAFSENRVIDAVELEGAESRIVIYDKSVEPGKCIHRSILWSEIHPGERYGPKGIGTEFYTINENGQKVYDGYSVTFADLWEAAKWYASGTEHEGGSHTDNPESGDGPPSLDEWEPDYPQIGGDDEPEASKESNPSTDEGDEYDVIYKNKNKRGAPDDTFKNVSADDTTRYKELVKSQSQEVKEVIPSESKD